MWTAARSHRSQITRLVSATSARRLYVTSHTQVLQGIGDGVEWFDRLSLSHPYLEKVDLELAWTELDEWPRSWSFTSPRIRWINIDTTWPDPEPPLTSLLTVWWRIAAVFHEGSSRRLSSGSRQDFGLDVRIDGLKVHMRLERELRVS